MSPRNRQPPKQQSADPIVIQQDDCDSNDLISQKDPPAKSQTVEISSAQAQLYFQYLRKKISHQANDPFSLPFLNLKFQQLDSWKGATQQLNLDSRIYGMRVDNCHDNAIKMLNYVIRNQQHQIGKDIGAAQKQARKQEQTHTNHQPKSNHNFYLQKPEKMAVYNETTIQLQNVSFWRTVFKKSQTLSQIQLNTVQLSSNLSLEIDLKKISYKSKPSDQNKSINQVHTQIDQIFCDLPHVNHNIQIFKEIEQIKKEVSEQVEEILEKRKTLMQQQGQQGQCGIENPMWEMNLGIRQIDFSEFNQDFNDFEHNYDEGRAGSQNQIFSPQFEDEPHQNIFLTNMRQLRSILIEPINDNSSEYEEVYEEDQLLTDLYQPQKDILFNSTYKKAKRPGNQMKGKTKRTDKFNVDFTDTTLMLDRKKTFKKQSYKKKHFKNNNLVPISYVVIYQNRNPFKKLKKVHRNHNKINIYDQSNNFQCFETQQISRGLDLIQTNAILENYPVIDYQVENDDLDQETSKYIKNVAIKAVKQEIMREIRNCDRSMLFSRPIEINSLQESQNPDLTSYMDTYLEEEASMIGLKFFKQKMKNYDPLDLLVSLLHVAFEEQIILQPVYSIGAQTNTEDEPILKDILIQGDQ